MWRDEKNFKGYTPFSLIYAVNSSSQTDRPPDVESATWHVASWLVVSAVSQGSKDFSYVTLIHPFRDGNGRIARVLSTLMALQAGLPLLDFSILVGSKNAYIAAIQAGLNKNYVPMESLLGEIIEQSRSSS